MKEHLPDKIMNKVANSGCVSWLMLVFIMFASALALYLLYVGVTNFIEVKFG